MIASMHNVSLPGELLEQLKKRRGRLRVFSRIDPAAAALIVVDMQNAFVSPDGFAYIPTASGIVPNINRFAGALRAVGGHVVWVRTTLGSTGRKAWRLYFDHFVPAGEAEARRAALSPEHLEHEFWPQLDIRNEDTIVDKDRFSAFIQDASDLEHELHRRGVDTVFVAGTLTNICCESTARDAMMRDYRAVMIEDANAARTDEDHIAGLRTFVQVFGDVVTTDEAIELVQETV